MAIRALQRHILLTSMNKGGRVDREVFLGFYKTDRGKDIKNQTNNVTKSLERLISSGYMVGYGRRTEQKWFITHIKLTAKGKKQAQKIIMEKQKRLPLK